MLILMLNGFLWAQRVNDSTVVKSSVCIKINPLKPFLGVANAGFEIALSNRFSVSLFGEYLMQQQLMIGNHTEHPLAVVELSPRIYLKNQSPNAGFYIGAITGFTLARKNSRQAQGLIVGLESGYKFFLDKQPRIFIEPKALLIHHCTGEEPFLPGIEGHIGITLQ